MTKKLDRMPVTEVTDKEQIGFDPLHPRMPQESKRLITMIVPGRRAFGEEWMEVTIDATPDALQVHRESAVAPENGRPIMIGPAEQEQASYIIDAMYEKAQERAKRPEDLTPQERFEAVNNAWHDYIAEKQRAFQGISQFGAAGFTQRQAFRRG